jgi:hypothetical protein
MAKTAEGFLICLSAPICRSGYQTYKVSEVDPTKSDDSEIQIYRPASEVASEATIASAEGAVVTLKHPAKFVTPDTFSWSAGGHCQNVRLGPKDEDNNTQLIADLHIKDRTVIEAIERGVRDLSCGYTYDLVQLSNGDWAQTNIRINHVAVVESGRAGTSKIQDSKSEGDDDMDGQKIDRLCDLLEKFLAQQGAGGEEEAEDDAPADGNLNPDYELAAGEHKLKGEVIPVPGDGAEGRVNPLTAKDARAAMASLKNLRPFIEANGDRKAKDAYNKAVKAVREQVALAEKYDTRTSAYDSGSRRSAAADFEASAAKFRGKAIRLHSDVNAPDDEHRAEDSMRREETFDEAVERVRQEQLARFTPKRRR